MFGGHLISVTYADAHNVQNPDEADQIMWGQVISSKGFQLMAYDVPSARPWSQGDSPFFVSVRGKDADEIAGYWEKLTDGSTVVVDLAPAAWVPFYGHAHRPVWHHLGT